MGDLSISFAPQLPIVTLWILAALALGGVAAALYWRLSGWFPRALAFGVLLLALAGPQLRQEDREGLPNVAFMVVDKTASTTLEDRSAQIDAAAAELADKVRAISTTSDPFELVTVEVGPDASDADRGTQLLTALDEASARVAPAQIAGAFLITDGQVHDPERLDAFPGPVHGLIAGEQDTFDLRLALETAPAFGIVGEEVVFRLRAEALGTTPSAVGQRVPATVSVDGGTPRPFLLELGTTIDLSIDIEHGGPTVVDIQLPKHPDELTDRNNRIISTVNGVRDRLRVLLVSGEPHPGGRTWRDLLKSDPTVDLIHFTILRPPAKQDGTPVSELSLIAFPTRELFLEKITGFDLIVFDRYRWRGVLSSGYLANVARYVREGGAILVASGPAFSGAQSLSRTPLADVLPAAPTVNIIERSFLPTVTELGQRHPVTAGLAPVTGPPTWGQWLRQIDVDPRSGHVVMAGDEGKPLLILDRVEDGRVALLASDHAWLWSRGYDGGGPQADLLRRVAHWLMKEPELEEEALFARVDGENVVIERRSLADESPDSVRAAPPDGGEVQLLPYTEVAPGRWQALLEGAEQGLWRLEDADAKAVAAVGPPSPAEYANPLASDALLSPLVKSTRGQIAWLSEQTPSVRAIGEDRRAGGRGWVGLVTRDAYRVTGVRLHPLMPALLAAALIGAFLLAAWMREGR
ncbi:MAG: glutamine amidotransferase [Pseudomonadota bacterium]